MDHRMCRRQLHRQRSVAREAAKSGQNRTGLSRELDGVVIRITRCGNPIWTKRMRSRAGAEGKLYAHAAESRIAAALADTPVVMVNGPRQITRQLSSVEWPGPGAPMSWSMTTLRLQRRRPIRQGAVHSRRGDQRRGAARPCSTARHQALPRRGSQSGRFLLAGSLMPQVAESLARHMEIFTLLPLAQAEIRGHGSRFLDAAHSGRVSPPHTHAVGKELMQIVLTGGYPEMLRRIELQRRALYHGEPRCFGVSLNYKY